MSELYRDAISLAPMVRAGTLPLRILSLKYGANLVYGEEIIDKRMINACRIENKILNTIDYTSPSGDNIIFRTCKEEQGKVVFQIGTASATLALQAAQQVMKDVAAIDVNMGCPKHFSIQGGMGAALLKKSEVAEDILKTLRRNLNIPVSCKIRLLEDDKSTVELMNQLASAGANAIGVHCRYIHERPTQAAHWDIMKSVVSLFSSSNPSIPVLANGDVYTHEQVREIQDVSGTKSVLIARGALFNASIFQKSKEMASGSDIIKEYLEVAAKYDNVFQNTKYNVSRMVANEMEKNPEYEINLDTVGAAKSNRDLYALWNREAIYDEYQQKLQDKVQNLLGLKKEANQIPFHANSKYYCQLCQLQLLSDQDMRLHCKGKKHKRKERMGKAITFSEQVAQYQAQDILKSATITVDDIEVQKEKKQKTE